MIWRIALGELPGGFHRLLPAACVLRAITILDRFECPPEFSDALSKIFANLLIKYAFRLTTLTPLW